MDAVEERSDERKREEEGGRKKRSGEGKEEEGRGKKGTGVGSRLFERPIAAWRLGYNYDIYGYYRHYRINATPTYIRVALSARLCSRLPDEYYE